MITRGEGGDMIMFNRLSHEPEDMLILSEGRSRWDQPFAAKRMTTSRVKSIETGFVGSERPLTKQQLIDNHMRIMTQNQRYIADVSWRHAFRILTRRLPGWSRKSGIRCNRGLMIIWELRMSLTNG